MGAIMNNPDVVQNIFLNSKNLHDLTFQDSYLYQYRPLNLNTYNQILGGYLWADSPNKFNDILDCATFHAFIEKVYKKIRGEWHEKKSENKTHLINALKNSLLISCLTSDNLNLTMWSHYAERNTGVCLEYDVTQISHYIFKIKYLDDIDRFNKFYKSARNELQEKFNEVFITILALMKLSTWSYEKEYRYISLERINRAGSEEKMEGKPINNVKLTGICFGQKTSPSQISLVKKLVEGKNIKLEKLEVRASENEFKIETSPLGDYGE